MAIKEKELYKIAFVATGGVIGSLARWLVSLGIVDHGFPWATLLVNYVGSVILALKIDQYLSDGNIHSVLAYSLASIVGTYILVFATNEILHTKWVRK